MRVQRSSFPLVTPRKAAPVAGPGPRPAAPAPRPVTPQARPAARAGEKPKFSTPDDFKNHVVRAAGYIEAARGEVSAAQRNMETIHQTEAAEKLKLQRALDAAQKDLADTHALYQAPIDRVTGELSAARGELEHAIYPGRRRAGQLNAEASAIASQLGELERQTQSAQQRFASLDTLKADAQARRASAQTARANAESELRRLESRVPAGTSAESARARAQSELDTAVRRLEEARSTLSRLQDTDRRRLAGLDGTARELTGQVERLEREVADGRSRLASVDGRIANELSRRQNAESARASAEADVRRLEPQASSSALAAQRTRTSAAQSRLSSANDRVSTASSRVSRARSLEGDISRLESARDNYASLERQVEDARESRSGYKGWVTRRQNELAAAKASGDGSAVVTAQSKLQEAMMDYNEADQKARRLESQLASLGSLSTINSQLSAKRSELSGLSGAAGELSRAQSEQASARSAYDAEKRKLDEMQALVSSLEDAIRRRDAASRTISEATRGIAALTGEKASLNANLPGLQSRLTTATRERDAARGAAERERSRQSGYGYLSPEKARLADAERHHDAARAAREAASALVDAIEAQRGARDGAVRAINQADANLATYASEKTQLPQSIQSLQAQHATKTRQRGEIVAEAKREHARENGPAHPQVVAARARVESLEQGLANAKKAYDDHVAPLQSRVNAEQQRYNQRTAELAAAVRDAGPRLEAAKQAEAAARKEFAALPDAVGAGRKLWWKLRYHFDVDQYWRERGVALAPRA